MLQSFQKFKIPPGNHAGIWTFWVKPDQIPITYISPMWWSNAPPKEACFACSEFEKKFLHVFWGLDYYLCLMFWTFKSKLGIFSPCYQRRRISTNDNKTIVDGDWRFNNGCLENEDLRPIRRRPRLRVGMGLTVNRYLAKKLVVNW